MAQFRIAWQERKSSLQAAGVKTSLFAQDLGPKLDGFEAAVGNYDRTRAKTERSDPKLVPLANAVRQACTGLLPIAVKYEEQLNYLMEHATDPRQKPVLENAESWLLKLMETVRQVQNKLPS